jgi:hypothetical protein
MYRKIIIALLFFPVLQKIAAQETIFLQSKWKFHSLNGIGLLQGESKAAFHLQSVNGFEKKNWFAGVGVGLDYYRYKSIPLFAEGRKYFGKTRNQFFIYADAGIHFVWEKIDKAAYYTEKYYPAFYGGAGIGYRAGFKNGGGFLLSAGYSYKRVDDEQQYIALCPSDGPCNLQINKYKYDLNRILLQIGLMF